MNKEDETAAAAHGGVLVDLVLPPNFNLEKAVCSHGLFMMAPNQWDPHCKTLKRPLRLNPGDDETSVMVHVSHSPDSPHALRLSVFTPHALSPLQRQYLLSQVRRMLRLSEEEDVRVIEFQRVHEEARARGFGRVFRSPTLFEDMVKCILMCNCQWSRTLSMAQSLCELQAELKNVSSASNAIDETGTISSRQTFEIKHFAPKTPLGKESKRRSGVNKHSTSLAKEAEVKASTDEILDCNDKTRDSSFPSRDVKDDIVERCNLLQATVGVSERESFETTESHAIATIGNFPSPRELASLDEKFLAKRCNLGYRASRIINLARGVIEGRIQLQELEYSCGSLSLSDYDKLVEKMRMIDGFGPFTCSNVLMCMGFYHVVPTDSETIRHLRQVHAKCSSNKTVQADVKDIYGKYAPFQFLAYWFEVWHFYEDKFGKLSELSHSDYKLITAANMRPKREKASKRRKLSLLMEASKDSACVSGVIS